MSQTSAWDAFVGTKALRTSGDLQGVPSRKAEELTGLGTPEGSEGRGRFPSIGRGQCSRPAVVADSSFSESSASGDDADMDAAAHEWLQEWTCVRSA